MRSLLMSTAVAAVLLLPGGGANAVIINLGVNPNSGQGDFSNGPIPGGAFEDDITFQLVGGPVFITVGSATNTFAGGSGTTDFITGFTGSIHLQLGGGPAPGDPIVLGPQVAAPCVEAPTTCQRLAGQALLNPGNYYLELTGTSGGTSGYGGNLSVFAVPGPVLGGGLTGLILACGGLLALARRRRKLVA
jgi:hypothetical protein